MVKYIPSCLHGGKKGIMMICLILTKKKYSLTFHLSKSELKLSGKL